MKILSLQNIFYTFIDTMIYMVVFIVAVVTANGIMTGVYFSISPELQLAILIYAAVIFLMSLVEDVGNRSVGDDV